MVVILKTTSSSAVRSMKIISFGILFLALLFTMHGSIGSHYGIFVENAFTCVTFYDVMTWKCFVMEIVRSPVVSRRTGQGWDGFGVYLDVTVLGIIEQTCKLPVIWDIIMVWRLAISKWWSIQTRCQHTKWCSNNKVIIDTILHTPFTNAFFADKFHFLMHVC